MNKRILARIETLHLKTSEEITQLTSRIAMLEAQNDPFSMEYNPPHVWEEKGGLY